MKKVGLFPLKNGAQLNQLLIVMTALVSIHAVRKTVSVVDLGIVMKSRKRRVVRMNTLRVYWMGKSPKVRAAVEEYIDQIKRFNITKYPFNFNALEFVEGWVSEADLAAKHGVSKQAVSQRIRDIMNYPDHRAMYFDRLKGDKEE